MASSIRLLFIFLALLTTAPAWGQRGRGGGDDDDGGGRGGFRGGGGDDDGERRGRGGFRGGPPGGFGGGRPGGFGGGPPGGFGGGRGDRGGFDPSDFLDRLDRNSNGVLEPDEMEGPARFMIQRLQRTDRSINPDRPIPMDKIKEAFEEMRGGGGGGDDDDEDDGLSAAMLVPGFGGIEPPPPVPGFGAAADLMAVRVTDADREQAEEIFRRYDRNRNNFIDSTEISSRWDGNPMDFDQNRDNRLSVNELAVRYARRRVEREEDRSERDDRRRRRNTGDDAPVSTEVEDRFEGRRSYRRPEPELPDGLPGWFADKDADGDGQVRMSEYASDWTDDLVVEFYGYDRNFDGIVTPKEVLVAVREGPGSSSRLDPATSSRRETPATVAADDLEEKYVQRSERIISRNDKNSDGALTVDEWKEMIMDISAADADKDGRITIEEYAGYMQARDRPSD